MGWQEKKLTGFSSSSGDFDGDAAGTVNGGTTIQTAGLQPGTLGALCTVDAETNTITLAAKWQVSSDDSTWYDVVEPYNPANVVLATGTAGADAAVTKCVQAPICVFGWRYTRCAIVNGVAEGNDVDTYTIAYYAEKRSGFVVR